MIGDVNVGKTCLLVRYHKNQLPKSLSSTIGVEFATKNVTMKDGSTVKAQLWDTAGQERFRTLTYQFYKQADGIIIAFDLTNKESFKNVKLWIQSIYKNLGQGDEVQKILVGNKLDLIKDTGDYV